MRGNIRALCAATALALVALAGSATAASAADNWASAAVASSEFGGSLQDPTGSLPLGPVGSTSGCTSELEGLIDLAGDLANNAPAVAQLAIDIAWSEARNAGVPLPPESPQVPDPGLPELPIPDIDLPDACSPAVAVDGVPGGNWSAEQATGPADTYPACGDIGTAWAPRSSSDDPESITTLHGPVENAQRVDIYETNIGGFVTQVIVHTADGAATTVFSGPDSTGCPGILSIALSGNPTVVGVEIHTQASGWEEIDAVSVVN